MEAINQYLLNNQFLLGPVRIVAVFLFFLQCKSVQHNEAKPQIAENVQTETIAKSQEEIGAHFIPKLNPENCRIKAKMVKIHPPNPEDKKALCRSNSCNAQIEILEIMERGFSFQGAITAGDVLEVQFTYSTSPSIEVFPGEKLNLPGLLLNDTIKTDIEGALGLMGNAPSIYTISTYTKL